MVRTSKQFSAFFLSFSLAGLGVGVAAVLAFVVLPSVIRPHVPSPGMRALSAAHRTSVLPGTSVAKISQRQTSLGRILVNGSGHTLYTFTRDSRDIDRCVMVNGCPGVWPIARGGGSVRAGLGVNRSLLGAISLPDGTRQVTYAGHPLYTYVGDSAPAEVDYVGVSQSGGDWPGIRASGSLVR